MTNTGVARLFITGDLHGKVDNLERFSEVCFSPHSSLTKNDYMVIVGDFGFVWNGESKDKQWLDWFEELPWTTVFCDGNHENFTLLNRYPVTTWNGGKVHKIRDSLIHLMRGEIYDLCDKELFVMGGAESHNKLERTIGKDWWVDEVPSKEEFALGLQNLDSHGDKVDIIISHTCASSDLTLIPDIDHIKTEPVSEYLDGIKNTTDYKYWFFGHLHRDCEIRPNVWVVYKDILEVT